MQTFRLLFILLVCQKRKYKLKTGGSLSETNQSDMPWESRQQYKANIFINISCYDSSMTS